MGKIRSFLRYFFLNPKQYTWLNFLLIAALLIFIRTTIVGMYTIDSKSMEDTLLAGDTVLVFRTWYGFRLPRLDFPLTPGFRPKHNDIIICRDPLDSGNNFIKRCVATGGEVMAITRKKLIVNGRFVPLPGKAKHSDPEIIQEHKAKRDFYPVIFVPRDGLFVLGDNRDNSSDSRSWGFLPRKNLLGNIKYVLWSLDPDVPWSDFRRKWRSGRFLMKVN